MISYGLRVAFIICVSKARLLATINPKRPPLRPCEELMFPALHIKLRHRVVRRTLRGAGDLRGGDRAHTINPSDLGLLPRQSDAGDRAVLVVVVVGVWGGGGAL